MNKKSTPICVTVENDDLEQLKEIARQKAVKEKQTITYGDLIRQLIKKFLGKNK